MIHMNTFDNIIELNINKVVLKSLNFGIQVLSLRLKERTSRSRERVLVPRNNP